MCPLVDVREEGDVRTVSGIVGINSSRPGSTSCSFLGSAEAGVKPAFLLSLSPTSIGKSML